MQSIFRDSDILDGVYPFKSGFREACAVLNKCDYGVGGEGGFTHAAGALNKKDCISTADGLILELQDILNIKIFI